MRGAALSLFIIGSVCWSVPVRAAVHLGTVDTAACSTVRRFERCELTLRLDGEVHNPYDPHEVTLDARFQPPQGDPITVSGFYYQPFERVVREGTQERIQAVGEPVWKVRFTPRSVGRWTYHLSLRTPEGTQSEPARPMLVTESSRDGFLRFHPRTGQFEFETGAPFIPVGENLAWGPGGQPLRAYETWFRELAQQRANYLRLWMAPWFTRLETKETGVGRYDQLRAWYMDQLLEQSRAAGLFWQLCLLNHGSFSRNQDPDWHNNPYNEALGGMCRLPNDFLTHPDARAVFQRLLRYVVNRWGYSPQLAVWELFNEADYGEFQKDDLIAWTHETSQFLRSIDVQQRPITTSFHRDAPAEVWRLPAIDAIQLHLYDRRDVAEAFCGPEIAALRQTFGKPVLIGEFGWIDETMRQIDDIGIHVHDGVWASLMGGAYGAALPWYWDTYIHPRHLERHFRPLAMFWRGERIGQQTRSLAVTFSDTRLEGCGIGDGKRMLLWVKNRRHNTDEYLAYRTHLAKQRLAASVSEPLVESAPYVPEEVRGATLTVPRVRWWGRYRVEWWDPYRGKVMSRQAGWAKFGTLTVDVPSLRFDLAAKLIRMPWWEGLGGSS